MLTDTKMRTLWKKWFSKSLVLALFILASSAHGQEEDGFESDDKGEFIDGYKYVKVRHPPLDGLMDWQYRLIFAEEQPKTEKPWSVRETLEANIDGESVTCQLPVVRVPLEPEAAVSEKDPNSLLSTLKGVCVKMMEGAWTYEVCYFQNIRQYLETGVQKAMRISHNYVLGSYVTPAGDHTGTERRKMPQLMYEGKKYPYHSQWYRDGTVCDLTGRPRETELRFFCQEKRTRIVEIDEIATCSYQINVGTPLLCSDPVFQTAPQVVSNVMCKGSDKAKTYDLAKRLQVMGEATAEHYWDWGRPIHQGGERESSEQSSESAMQNSAGRGPGEDGERIRIMLPPGKDGHRIVVDFDQFGNVVPAQGTAGRDHAQELLSQKNPVTHYYSNSNKKRKTPTGLCFTAANSQWFFSGVSRRFHCSMAARG